jgi:hypothetical protein
MEYAMSNVDVETVHLGIYGTATHELGTFLFQHVLASNESKHPWMDEGFTTYVSDLAENEFATKKSGKPSQGNYRAYYSLVNSKSNHNHPWRPL